MGQSGFADPVMKQTPKNHFGAALRAARRAAGVPQEGFGLVSSRTYMSMLERSVRNPTLNKIDDLAPVLGIHPASLVVMSYLSAGASAAQLERLLARIRAEVTAGMAEFERSPAPAPARKGQSRA